MACVVYWESLLRNVTITADDDCQHLRRFPVAIQERKRAERLHQMLGQHDYPRPHPASTTKVAICRSLVGKYLSSSPYFSYPRLLGFHLFRSLSINIQGNPFDNENALQTRIVDFFNYKPADFCRSVIEKLLQRW